MACRSNLREILKKEKCGSGSCRVARSLPPDRPGKAASLTPDPGVNH